MPLTIRKNICLPPDTLQMGEVIVEVDHRPSFSNMLAALINADYQRRFPSPQDKARAMARFKKSSQSCPV